MPAMLDDPSRSVIFRTSGPTPYPTADNPQIPSSIFPRPVTLRDRVTVATLVPFFSPSQVPGRLLSCLCDQLNKEIEGGDTYPMIDPMTYDTFGPYWFGNFAAVMLLGDIGGLEAVQLMEDEGCDWSKICLGSFYVKPNYPGRSSHICNGGFLVTPAARNKGVGKSMGECYLDWAPQLGFTYSIFNLVYETNTASMRIWDSLGFKRIGKVPAAGNLKSSPELVDAIIYGRDLSIGSEDIVSEERFDKIRYYLKHNNYPTGADRAEKSRLRSAATHYKLVAGEDGKAERLMLKGREVISDPKNQMEIARAAHGTNHAGINKTTANIATKYHWVRIKETVGTVIKNCEECKEAGKVPVIRPDPLINHSEQPASGLKSSPSMPPSMSSSQVVPTPVDSNDMSPESRYMSQEAPMLTAHAYHPAKADPFSAHGQQNMQSTIQGMEDYQNIAMDPIMQQLQSQLQTQYSQEDPYQQADMSHFSDAQLHHQHHHAHSGEYHVDEDEDHLMAQAAVSMSLDPDEPMPHHLLPNGYVDTDGNTHFDQ